MIIADSRTRWSLTSASKLSVAEDLDPGDEILHEAQRPGNPALTTEIDFAKSNSFPF